MDQDLLTLISQFGAAGLIAGMWLVERRHTARRDAQLTEAHEHLREQKIALDQLLAVVTSNTRAAASLEAAQRALLDFLRTRDAERDRRDTDRTAA